MGSEGLITLALMPSLTEQDVSEIACSTWPTIQSDNATSHVKTEEMFQIMSWLAGLLGALDSISLDFPLWDPSEVVDVLRIDLAA